MSSLSKYSGACGGKVKYSSKKEAARAATRLRKRIIYATDFSEPIEYYHCVDCHCYHLGHKKGWRRETGIRRPVIKVAL